MDQEKILLVEKMCRLKRELAKMDEKMAFYEEHATQLTEDIQRKSKLVAEQLSSCNIHIFLSPSPILESFKASS